MRDINGYCRSIWSMFQIELKKRRARREPICELQSISFDDGSFPDYEDDLIRLGYLLRYAYGYAHEYRQMYRYLIEEGRLNPYEKNIKVTSIGCGSMIDYLSLVSVLEEYQSDATVEYVANDLADWKDLADVRRKDMDKFQPHFGEDAADMFRSLETLDSDVYIFPKSISELPLSVIDTLFESFKEKEITKDKVHLLVSIRKNENPRSDRAMNPKRYDFLKTDRLMRGILRNGYAKKGRKVFRVVNIEKTGRFVNLREDEDGNQSGYVYYRDREGAMEPGEFVNKLMSYLQNDEPVYFNYLNEVYRGIVQEDKPAPSQNGQYAQYPYIHETDQCFERETYAMLRETAEKLQSQCAAVPASCASCVRQIAKNSDPCREDCRHRMEAEGALMCGAGKDATECRRRINRYPIGRTGQVSFVALTFERKRPV